MNSREKLSTHKIGTYSELIVAAAFTATGCEVAMPIGNQSDWDLIVREDGKWLTVQVKTVSASAKGGIPTLQMRDPWKHLDCDLIVAVHPETGSLWRIIPVDGRTSYGLRRELLWRGAIEAHATPYCPTQKAFAILRSESLAEQRTHFRNRLPAEKPEYMSRETWEAIAKWCNGEGYKAIAKGLGISPIGARERIVRGLYRFGMGPGIAQKKPSEAVFGSPVDSPFLRQNRAVERFGDSV